MVLRRNFRGSGMKLLRRRLPPSNRERCRAADSVALRAGANLSDAAGADDRSIRAGGHNGHCRAPYRPMAIRASVTTIRHRETGRVPTAISAPRPPCERPLMATQLLMVDASPAINATLYDNSISILPRDKDTPRLPRFVSDTPHPGGPSVDSCQNHSRVHCLCQGQSGQDQLRLCRHR